MQLTCQHFQFIAENIGEVSGWCDLTEDQFAQIVTVFEQNLRYINPNFDDARFRKECYKQAQRFNS